MAKRGAAKAASRSRRKHSRPRGAEAGPAANHERSVVGDLVNFRGLVYAPMNEAGVIFLFGKVAADLNMYVEEIKPGFPDCIARRFTGKGWERVRVEFEFCSSSFRQHGHDPRECDVIVCWEHDWPTCPIEVIELRERTREMENTEIERPGEMPPGPQGDIKEWFKRHRVQQKVAPLFERLWNHLRGRDERIFYKVGERAVSFYSPERVFIYMYPRKKTLRLQLFTGGRKLGKVKQFEFRRGAEKWGGVSIASDKELVKALPWITDSLRRIRKAIARNEPTGWYATLNDDAEG